MGLLDLFFENGAGNLFTPIVQREVNVDFFLYLFKNIFVKQNKLFELFLGLNQSVLPDWFGDRYKRYVISATPFVLSQNEFF